jgi:hypothetical protein
MSGGAALDPAVAALSRTALGPAVWLATMSVLGLPRRGGTPPERLLALFGVAGAASQITLFASFAAVAATGDGRRHRLPGCRWSSSHSATRPGPAGAGAMGGSCDPDRRHRRGAGRISRLPFASRSARPARRAREVGS